MQKVALAATLQFTQHRFPNDTVVFGSHKGFDGQAPLRRSGNHAQVAQTLQGHAQSTRDGRGGEGQHIHLGSHGFDGFFVSHPKAVFLVDD